MESPGIACQDGKIALGEEGRGRVYRTVPVPSGAEMDGQSLVAIQVPGEGPNEVLLRIPDCSGFRGHSVAEQGAGSLLVAQGRCAQGIAGRIGGGTDSVFRLADGGWVTVRRSGRQVEWTEAEFHNLGGVVVRRNSFAGTPAPLWPTSACRQQEGEIEAALFGDAPELLTFHPWVNLTPHEVTILGGASGTMVIPRSGQVARVAQTLTEAGQVAGVRIVRSTFGAVQGLPEPAAGTSYIVSAMVRSAVPERRDVFSPTDFDRDAAGKIVGCRAMEAN